MTLQKLVTNFNIGIWKISILGTPGQMAISMAFMFTMT